MPKKEKPAKENQPNQTTTIRTIYQKLQIVQSQIGQLEKTRENKFQKYFYAGEYDLLKVIKPLLATHQLTLIFSDEITPENPFLKEQLGKEWLVQYLKKAQLINAENEQEQLTYYFWAMAQNTDLAKAKGSAETYAIKYFLQKFFLIPVSDNLDPDAFDTKGSDKATVTSPQSNSGTTISMKQMDDLLKTADKQEEESPLTKKPKKTEFTPQATVVITNIKAKFDKNNNQYLLLETDTLANNVFVFPYKVADSRWPELTTGKTYQFNLEESDNGLLVLVDFSAIS